MHGTHLGSRAICEHKPNMSFTQVQAAKKLYTQLRNCAKDQMLAMGIAPAGWMAKDSPDTDFLPIYTGMKTWRPAWDHMVSSVPAPDWNRVEDLKEAVVDLVKDGCYRFNDPNNQGKIVVPNAAIPARQVIMHALLLRPRATHQWVAATTIGNPGHLPRNPPPAHVTTGGQVGQAPP